MHGIVHKTLEEYVIEKTDDDTWDTIIDRAGVEPTLYLTVSSYDDREIDAIIETLSSMATQERAQIERDFGRTLAPELLSTFDAHIRADWGLFDLLVNFESIRDSVGSAADDSSLPALAVTRESGDSVRVTYPAQQEPTSCALAQGLLDGLVGAAETDATITKTACLADGDDECAFLVESH